MHALCTVRYRMSDIFSHIECVVSRMSASWRIRHVTYEWVMSHMIAWCNVQNVTSYVNVSHDVWVHHNAYVTSHMNESCHIWMQHVTYKTSRHNECVISRIYASWRARHVTYEWVTSRIKLYECLMSPTLRWSRPHRHGLRGSRPHQRDPPDDPLRPPSNCWLNTLLPHTHTHIHIYIHTYTHTHTYTHPNPN